MAKSKIFIRSFLLEFSKEREMLFEYISSDPLLGKFFEPFIFERLPEIDKSVNKIYLKEVFISHISRNIW